MRKQPATTAQYAPQDVYQLVTDRVLAALEGGIIPWRKPWDERFGAPRNYVSNRAYSGINAFLLNLMNAGAFFVTFKQALELGGHIRKGSKGIPVLYFQVRLTKNKQTQEEERQVIAKSYTVFSIADVDGVELPLPTEAAAGPQLAPIASAEALVTNWAQCPPILSLQQRAYYSPLFDHVNMPSRESFASSEEYYSTLFHELTHATGHPRRLNRADLTAGEGKASGSYAREELTAEMGAAFLCALTGLSDVRTLPNTQAYIQSWLGHLRNDKKLLIQAASRASKAAAYITGTSGPGEGEDPQPAPSGTVDGAEPAAAVGAVDEPANQEPAPQPGPGAEPAESSTAPDGWPLVAELLRHPAFGPAERSQRLAEAGAAGGEALAALQGQLLASVHAWEDAQLRREGGELAAPGREDAEPLAEPAEDSEDPHELLYLAVCCFAHLRPFEARQTAGELAADVARHLDVGEPRTARLHQVLLAHPTYALPYRARPGRG